MSAQYLQSVEQVTARFQSYFGRQPQFVTRAPGRVNLIGEHIDYNGGVVLPMAIERSTYIAADFALEDEGSTIRSANLDEVFSFTDAHQPDFESKSWAPYFLGVHQLFPATIPHLDVLIDSDVPMGAGLSSSAALEVATLQLLMSVTGVTLDLVAGAKLCQRAEHEYAGVPCGIMDQLASLAGQKDRAIMIDCLDHSFRYVEGFDAEMAFIIVNSMESHSLASGSYAKRRAECKAAAKALDVELLAQCRPDVIAAGFAHLDRIPRKRAQHVFSEVNRVQKFMAAVRAKDWPEAGAILYASHASLRDDFEVSAVGLDHLVDIAREIDVEGGVYGCRMTGGGFGGAVIALVDRTKAESIMERFSKLYAERTGQAPECLLTRPGAGAEILLQPC